MPNRDQTAPRPGGADELINCGSVERKDQWVMLLLQVLFMLEVFPLHQQDSAWNEAFRLSHTSRCYLALLHISVI